LLTVDFDLNEGSQQKEVSIKRQAGTKYSDNNYNELLMVEENTPMPEYMVHWKALTDKLTDVNTAISTLLTSHEE
jgi:hypothetical protein